MTKGKVFIVGAGPGDPTLLTVKAAALLREADVVIYDRLVDQGVLNLVKRPTKTVYAGKDMGERGVQERINELMVSEARKGRTVVRLKGGDPFIFGRGGEEMETLARHHIDYEVVPGVTSALAAPAYAGIPLTHRAHSSSVLIVTGHDSSSKKNKVDWKRVAGAADTIVVLMGAGKISERARDLIAGGLDKETPIAIVERATTKKQRTRLCTLGFLAGSRGGVVDPPSVIVIGPVASLAETLGWFRVNGRTTIELLDDRKGRKSG